MAAIPSRLNLSSPGGECGLMKTGSWWMRGAHRYFSISFPAVKRKFIPPARIKSFGLRTIWSPGDSVRLQSFDLQKTVQLPQARGMAHLAERLGLNLPDAFAGDIELLADLLQRARVAIPQAKTQLQNPALAFVQAAQHVAQFALQEAETGQVQRAFGGLVLDEIAEVRILAVAHRRLQRDRLLCHFQDGTHPVHGQLEFIGQFLRRGFAAQ